MLTPAGQVREIGAVVTSLATGSPAELHNTLHSFFLSDASFSHPFCRVASFAKGFVPWAPDVDSRSIILHIYRWYRTLSPHIEITVDSAGSVFDQRTGKIFVSIHQTFAIWFIPLYKARVNLVTVLQLRQRLAAAASDVAARQDRESTALAGPVLERTRYFIASQ